MPVMVCPKCGGPMTSGYLLDKGQQPTVAGWVEGKPEKSFWTGLKLTNRRRFEVVADRCEKCGFLELWA